MPEKGLLWILGLLSFSGFVFVTIGNIGMARLLVNKRFTTQTAYWLGRIALSVSVIVFSFQRNIPGYIIGYLMVYVFLGGSNIAESTLLNREIPSKMRASMLSFTSLVSQLGGLGASVIGSSAVEQAGINRIWLFTGLVLLAISALSGYFLGRLTRSKGAVKTTTDIVEDKNIISESAKNTFM